MSEGVIIAQLQERDFYLLKPKSFLIDAWLWILVFFPLASTVGLSVLAYFGFGFTVLQSIGNQESLTRLAAACLALGEIGSFFAAIEVFRKAGRGETIWWDWVAMVTSGVTTATVVAVGWAWTMELSAWWKVGLQQNTPLFLSVLAVLDTILAGSEAGLYLSQGNRRLKAWQVKYERWAARQEKLIRRYQESIWERQEAAWELEIKQWDTGDTDLVAPPSHAAQAEDKVLPDPPKKKPLTTSATSVVSSGPTSVGPVSHCWCGRTYPRGGYKRHMQTIHLPEIAHCQNAEEARGVLLSLYVGRNIPGLSKLARWLGGTR